MSQTELSPLLCPWQHQAPACKRRVKERRSHTQTVLGSPPPVSTVHLVLCSQFTATGQSLLKKGTASAFATPRWTAKQAPQLKSHLGGTPELQGWPQQLLRLRNRSGSHD